MFEVRVRGLKSGLCLAASLLFSVAFYGCGKDKDKKNGSSIGAPAVEPPVTRNVPEGLKGASLHLDDPNTATSKSQALSAVRALLASGGTGPSFVYRLEMVDKRISELNKRAEESEKACLADSVTPKSHNIGGSLPGGAASGMMFQCQENVSSPGGIAESQLAFGLTADSFYLMERTVRSGTNGIIVLAKTAMDGSSTGAWEIATDGDDADFKHIRARDGIGLEASIAGSKTTSGSGACGLHVKSNGTYIYLKGSVSAGAQCSAEITACFDAKTGAEIATAQCTGANLNSFELASLTPALARAAVADAKAIVAKKITGHIDFTADAEVPGE